MAGVSSCYHGETGRVIERTWLADDDQLFFVIRLDDDPHRKFSYAYGSDIRIDPAIVVGDHVTFVRLDAYCGLWVRAAEAHYPQLKMALDRSGLYDQILRDWSYDLSDAGLLRKGFLWLFRSISLKRLQTRTGISVRTVASDQAWFEGDDESSEKKATFFLSYSSRNVLMARQLYEDIIATTDVDVWFDLTKGGEAGDHDKHVEEWLNRAVGESRGLVVLLTKASVKSDWVAKEIGWAGERARTEPGFQLIVLKLADVSVPAATAACGHVIDAEGLWWDNGIVEELFAALYDRPGRQAWLRKHAELGIEGPHRDPDTVVFHYEDYESEAGIAEELRSYFKDGHFYWELSYRRGKQLYSVSHMGMQCAVDLGIKKGDRIASFVSHRNSRARFLSGLPVWMRSDELSLSAEQVIADYREKVPEEDRFRTLPLRPGEPPAELNLSKRLIYR